MSRDVVLLPMLHLSAGGVTIVVKSTTATRAVRDHAGRDGQLADASVHNSDRGRQLSRHGGGSKCNREREQGRAAERGQICAEPHQNEEQGHEKRGHGSKELTQWWLAPLNKNL